jgi:protein TonB
MAKMARITGDVIIYSILAKDGSLQDLKILDSPHPILSEAAMEAVKQWRYAPPMCGSVPVSVENEVTVRFHM